MFSVQPLVLFCVGGSSESIVRSSERLVKRKSCSPDSQKLNPSIFCLRGRLGPPQPNPRRSAFVKTLEQNGGSGEKPFDSEGRKPNASSHLLFTVFFFLTLLDLDKTFKNIKFPTREPGIKKVATCHRASSVFLRSLRQLLASRGERCDGDFKNDTAAVLKNEGFPDLTRIWIRNESSNSKRCSKRDLEKVWKESKLTESNLEFAVPDSVWCLRLENGWF